MKNAVLTFLVLMTLLGVGTILVVEKYAGEQILPRSIQGFSIGELSGSYERARRALKRWWNKAANNLPSTVTPMAAEEELLNKKIIKWQDAQGVWHYEYAAPAASESPAPPP